MRADSGFFENTLLTFLETRGIPYIDLDGYTFRVFVTHRQGDGAELWRDYNQRAYCEQPIEELKHDLQADGFCVNDFYIAQSWGARQAQTAAGQHITMA